MASKLSTLQDLYIDELRDLHHAEKQLIEALPEWVQAASSSELKEALQIDADRTRQHLQRLETIMQSLDQDPSGHTCKGMEGLLQECRDRIRRSSDNAITDAGMVLMAQKAQHYEMAGYGTVCTYARLLNRDKDAEELHRTLEEEKKADSALTQLAQETINVVAASAV